MRSSSSFWFRKCRNVGGLSLMENAFVWWKIKFFSSYASSSALATWWLLVNVDRVLMMMWAPSYSQMKVHVSVMIGCNSLWHELINEAAMYWTIFSIFRIHGAVAVTTIFLELKCQGFYLKIYLKIYLNNLFNEVLQKKFSN